MGIILVCGCTCWWLKKQPMWWKCSGIFWDDKSVINQIRMIKITVDKLTQQPSSASLQVWPFCSSVPFIDACQASDWYLIDNNASHIILNTFIPALLYMPRRLTHADSRCTLTLPPLNLGDVLRNAISGPTITLTISWWSESEALWDIDSPHPETAS